MSNKMHYIALTTQYFFEREDHRTHVNYCYYKNEELMLKALERFKEKEHETKDYMFFVANYGACSFDKYGRLKPY